MATIFLEIQDVEKLTLAQFLEVVRIGATAMYERGEKEKWTSSPASPPPPPQNIPIDVLDRTNARCNCVRCRAQRAAASPRTVH